MLYKVAAKPDAEVETNYTYDEYWAGSSYGPLLFANQRELARTELEKRSSEKYRPEVFIEKENWLMEKSRKL